MLTELFERVVARHSDREAARGHGVSLTYQAVKDLGDRVAHAVLESGVRQGDRVVILFETSPEVVAAMLGVVKTGAIAVLVGSTTPEVQRQQVLEDAEPACVVTDAPNLQAARALAMGRIPVIDAGALPAAPDRAWPRLDSGAPVVMLYTSGSTGRPKGVVHTHRSLGLRIMGMREVYQTEPADRFTMFSSFAMGQGLMGIFCAVLYGATLCMFDARRHGFDRLTQWLAAERITIFISSATLFRSLMRTEGSRVTCPDLRLVRIGGESVTVEDVELCRRHLSRRVQFVVNYAATETSGMTTHLVGADEEFPLGRVPVGRPLPGVRISIAGEDGQPLPQGEPGEIVVHGQDLPSYWRESADTQGRYRDSPDVSGERCFFTGDRGRIREDGCVEYLGRVDRRVKVRGYRVELDEVERALGQYPLAVRSAVVALPNGLGDLTIVGYVECADPDALRSDDLRRFLSGRLADYKVPSTFIALERMPLSDAGKVLRSRLPAPETVRPLADAPMAMPETDMQRLIAASWLEVLSLTVVSIDDGFFMVGGDSLRAAQVGSRLSETLGIEVPMSLLLDASTIRQLAERLEVHVAELKASPGVISS